MSLKIIKIRYLTAVLLIIALNDFLFAQDHTSFFSINSGVSFPMGDYQKKNLQTGSFALAGYNVNVEGAWFFKPFLGIGGQASLNFHPVDVSALGYEKVQSDPFLLDVTIRSDPYRIITSAVGLYARWNILKYLYLQGKLLGGMMWVKTPYQLYKPEYYLVGPEYFEITSSKGRNMMGIIGVGFQVDVSPCISLKLDNEYQFSEMIFGFNTASGKRYDYRRISFVNINLGLVINL